MSKFKIGDRVRFVQKSSGTARAALVGSEFTLGDYAGSWDGESAWSTAPCNGYRFKESELELVQPASPPSPVRTKTVKEIVPGTYGPVFVSGPSLSNRVASVSLTPDGVLNASELREAARIFNELADALDEQ